MLDITTQLETKEQIKTFSNEGVKFLLLLFITVVLRKISPDVLFSFFLFLTLLFFYNSKNNWLYIVFALVLTFDVGGIIGFNGYPIINGKRFIIMYYQLFSIVAFIKTIRQKNNFIIFAKYFKLWLYYGIFLLIYGYFVFGPYGFEGRTGFRYYWYLILLVLPFLLFFSIDKLIKTYNDLHKISEILFILVFLNLLGQLFYIIKGFPIFYYIIGVHTGETSFLRMLGESVFQVKEVMRPEYGAIIRFLALFLAVFYYYENDKYFRKNYLLLVISTILLSTIITATRGWIIAFFFFLLLSAFLSSKGGRIIKLLAIFFIVFLLLFFTFEPLKIQVIKSWERLTTIEKLLQGDLTAGGTNRRLTDRAEPVMDVFYKNPVFGVGISGLGMNTSDIHVGNETILMGGGVIEMLIFLAFLYSAGINIYLWNKKLYKVKRNYKGSLLLILFNILCLLIIHSSSSAMFGWLVYAVRPEKIFFIAFLFVIYNKIIIYKIGKL